MAEPKQSLHRSSLLRDYFLALVEELEDVANRLPSPSERTGALRHIGEIRAELGVA
ncbi:MAG TPA: hypothetical protein VGV89_01520 [Thermoplasmata archaeon]|nr:hypothetical protein [Thermoplasmata archaeon]